MLLLILACTHLPEPVDLDAAQVYFDGLSESPAFGRARAAGGAEIDLPQGHIRLDEGMLVPLEVLGSEGTERTVALLFSGQGTLEVRPTEPGDALALAQDLAMFGASDGVSAPDVASFPLDRFLVVSADPAVVEAPLEGLAELVGDDQPPTGVLPRLASSAAREMYGQLSEQVVPGLLHRAREDVLLQEVYGAPASEARVEGGLHVRISATSEGWLRWIRDPGGMLSPWEDGLYWNVAPDTGRMQVLAASPAPQGWDPQVVEGRAVLEVTPSAQVPALDVVARTEVVLEAIDEPLVAFRLRLPQEGPELDGWELEGVRLASGEDIAVRATPAEPLSRQPSGVLCVLPRPLPAGETVTVEVDFRTRWPFDITGIADGHVVARGPATGIEHPFALPYDGDLSPPWSARIAVGLPEDSDLQALVTGDLQRSWTEGGRRWVEYATDGPVRLAGLAIGRWVSETRAGAVELSVSRFDEPEQGFAPDLAEAVGWLDEALRGDQAVLGPFPWRRVGFFEGPSDIESGWWHTAPGLVVAGRFAGSSADLARMMRRYPGWPDSFLAHEIAHAWWGHTVSPATADDIWIQEALAQVTACLALDRVRPRAERCAAMQARWRQRMLGGRRKVSLVRSVREPDWERQVYAYAPLLLLRTLRARTGEEAFESGLRLALERYAGSTISTDQLRDVFEEASGVDLDDFFLYWVRAGRLPELWATTEDSGGGRVTGEVHASPPVGKLVVPVRVRVGEEAHDLDVKVEDGVGTFAVEGEGEVVVEVDPRGELVAKVR